MINLDDYDNELSDEDFLNKIIVPAYYGNAAYTSSRFGISNFDERLIICSEDYAKEIGFNDFKQAMDKYPGVDYPRYGGSKEQFHIQRDYFEKHKKPFNYMCKYKNTGKLYLTSAEPILNVNGDLVGKKEVDTEIKMFSHRELIETHFKRYDINLVSSKNLSDIQLTPTEETILFMLIAGYTQNEIGEFLKVSRSRILRIIAESLCIKFNLKIVSTKVLIDKAVSMGFAHIIPKAFLDSVNGFYDGGEILH